MSPSRRLAQAQAITKHYGRTSVLRDVSFSVNENETVGLIGPNGAGKTTLMECVAGLIPADKGTFSFRGELIAPEERKRILFYMPDGIRPWPEQTVAAVLRLFEQMYGSHGQHVALVERLQLGHLLGRKVSALSKGESKRLLLCLVLLTPYPLLMLDEPFDGLDLRQTRAVMELLREHVTGGRTLLLSIHQLIDAERICDRLVLLNNGAIAGEGTLAELRERAGHEHGGLEEVFLALT